MAASKKSPDGDTEGTLKRPRAAPVSTAPKLQAKSLFRAAHNELAQIQGELEQLAEARRELVAEDADATGGTTSHAVSSVLHGGLPRRMDMTTLRDELTQCWLAEALAHVVERAVTRRDVVDYALLSFGETVVIGAHQGVVRLVNAFLCPFDGVTGGEEGTTHVNDVEALRQWAASRVDPNDRTDLSAGMLLIIYAPCLDSLASSQLHAIVEAVADLHDAERRLVLLVLHNPRRLLGLTADGESGWDSTAGSSYHLQSFNAECNDQQSSLKFLAQPLERLHEQCGWRFVLDLVSSIDRATSSSDENYRVDGARQAAMFSSMAQLPFQLLLLVLRWSHFHPQLVQACEKKLRRQTQLIPQSRVRRELQALQQREAQLWKELDPPLTAAVPSTASHYERRQASLLSLNGTPSRALAASPQLSRLSGCQLWETQKRFYQEQGIRAWSSGAIPFGVSSSSFLAASYARIAVDFLLSSAISISPFSSSDLTTPNCFVWEAASGSCKFLHAFMLHFVGLVEAESEFRRRGLVPLVVGSDLSDQVLASRRQMSCFRPFLERGQLDFARFDTHSFVHGDPSSSKSKKTLMLEHSQREWRVGSDGPVMLLGNYFLDSLRSDVFAVASRPQHAPTLTANDGGSSEGDYALYEALLDRETSSIADMEVQLHVVPEPKMQPIYENKQLNATLLQVLDRFQTESTSSSSIQTSGLVVFPVEALQFLLTLVNGDDGSEQPFPIAILAGDARFSFHDEISSAFITTTGARIGLELPQLSPHPDCFCLPVDFEILQLFFESLNSSAGGRSTRAQVASAPASDTFDVFYATVEPLTSVAEALHTSFRQQFESFTPGDCDLLWGMMSFDDGARCFSTDTLLALLAQTGWDFDLFDVLHWGLLSRWRRQRAAAKPERVQHYQRRLVDTGIKCWQTFYAMEQRVETDVNSTGIRLQLARWFYGGSACDSPYNQRQSLGPTSHSATHILLLLLTELEAYDHVLEVLALWNEESHGDSSSSADVGVFYLLAVTIASLSPNLALIPDTLCSLSCLGMLLLLGLAGYSGS
ncbi:hypothetical protein BBJ28_00002969 [Nothophytophthora sp. Chile5]|nr:hypothetical protein BBJ28_00002969 [Nothophytophthora sp. Chile5]